jgi:hypothetical protein
MATTTFNDLITFSRGSNATVTGPNGLIQWAPSNIVTSSQDFEAASWFKGNSTVYPNQNIPGGALGPELVTNGDFSNGTTGWSLQTATAVVAGGEVTVTSTGVNYGQIYQSVTTVAGTWYRISATMRVGTASSVNLRAETTLTVGNLLVQTTTSTSNVVITGYFLATGASTIIGCANSNTSNGTGIFDNISVQAVTPAAAIAPDGTQTADTWVPTSTATTAGVRLLGSFSVTSGSIQTASIYVKSAGKRWLFMTAPSASSDNDNCWFDLQNGVVGTIGSSALSATITAVGNGWYRVTTTSIAVSATNYIFISATTGNNTTAVTADGTGLLIWGAQLELGSTAATYNNTSVRNLLGFSEAFDNAAWQKLSASIVTGAQANPVNGLFNAQKLMEDTSTGIHRTFQTATLVVAPYTFSFYAKPAGRDWLYINVSGAAHTAFVNIATGAVGATVGSPTVTMTPLSGGWYRVAMTYSNASAGASNQQIWLASNSTTTSYTGDGNSGVYIYGAQLSNSASLDPYVPTPGAAPSSTAYYGPRFDYDPVTLLPRGLLIEEQRTNSLTYSEQFDNAAWTKVNATVTANAAVAPDGTSTADKVIATNSASTTRAVYQNFTSLAATTYTVSVYVKAAEYSLFAIQEIGGGRFGASFNLANQTTTSLGGGGFVSSSISPVGGGWYRCLVVWTGLAASNAITFIGYPAGASVSAAGTNYAGDGTSGILIWGAQLEAGAFATSYIPTIASTVTRSADVATITGSLFSQWYNQSTGAFVVDGSYLSRTNFRIFLTADNAPAVTNRIMINGDQDQQLVVTDTTTVVNLSAGTAPAANVPTKIASAYLVNDFAAVRDGGTVATDTSGTVPALNRLAIGYYPNGALYANGHIRSIRYVPVRAADFQLQALTAPPELLSLNIYDRFNDLVLDRAGQTIEVR